MVIGIVSLFVIKLKIFPALFVIQTLDVLLQVLVIFPKIEPLRIKVRVEDSRSCGTITGSLSMHLSSDDTFCAFR